MLYIWFGLIIVLVFAFLTHDIYSYLATSLMGHMQCVAIMYTAISQRLIVLAHDDLACEEGLCPAGVHYTYDFSFETPFAQKGLDELMRVDLTCSVSRGWSNSDFIFSNHFAADERGLPDVDIAAQVNTAENLQTRLDYCQEKFTTKYKNDVINLLVVDFWNVGDTLAVVDKYNRQLPPKTEAPSEVPTSVPTASPKPSAAPSANANTNVNIADILLSVAPSLAPILTTAAPTEEPTQIISTLTPTTGATAGATSNPTFSSVNSFFDSILTGDEDTTTGAPSSSNAPPESSLLDDNGIFTVNPTTTNADEEKGEAFNFAEEVKEDEPSNSNGHSFTMPEKDSAP